MRNSEDMVPKISAMVPYYYHDNPIFADPHIICMKISSCYTFFGKKYIFFFKQPHEGCVKGFWVLFSVLAR